MIKSKLLSKYPEIVYGVSTVGDGNMSFLYGEADEVVQNRRRFLAKFDTKPEDFVALRLGMVDAVDIYSKKDKGRLMLGFSELPYCDAAITADKGLGLFLMTADCTPAVIYDSKQKVIAVVHMSWQCTDQELARKTVELMETKFGSQAADLVVFMGPGVKKETYIHENPSQRQDPRWQPFIKKVETGYSIDVVGFNKQQLTSAGVKPENIEESPVNTTSSEDYFSHYRSVRSGEPEGRSATIFMMRA